MTDITITLSCFCQLGTASCLSEGVLRDSEGACHEAVNDEWVIGHVLIIKFLHSW